jgi:hypothetical protein
MPRSPLTWFIALAIVLFHALALFVQRTGEMPVMDSALGATCLLVILLGWSATRDAPPFSDRAFHRTLPPGDGVAFRSVLAIHLLVLLGISVVIAIYCLYFNFGWESVGRGTVFLTLPLAIFMAIFGIGAAIASSPGKERFLGLPLILGVPVCSFWVIPWRLIIMVVVDRNGKHGHAIELSPDGNYWGSLWLGSVQRWVAQLDQKGLAQVGALQGGRLYLFFPREVSSLRSETLLPPGRPR